MVDRSRSVDHEHTSPRADQPYTTARGFGFSGGDRRADIIVLIIVGLMFISAIFFGGLAIAIGDAHKARARDDGRYANSPLKGWFDQLASGKGLCCSFADGFSVQDVDWDTLDGRYRVRLHGEWVVVPDNALVTEPNRFGPAVVWPYTDAEGTTQIRCFLPSAMS